MISIKHAFLSLSMAITAINPADAADATAPNGAVALDNGWRFHVTLDGWFTALNGNIGVRGLPAADVKFSALDAINHLDGAFAASFKATNDSWLLYSDFMWAKISADADFGPSTGHADLDQEQVLFSAMVGYELPINVPNMQLYATGGLRYQYYKVDLQIDPAFFPSIDRSGSKNWIDPIVGMAIHYDINDRWFVDGMADVGGFGVASDFTAQGSATLGYNWTDSISTSIGYRALYTDYKDAGFRYDATQHGLFTRLAFNF